MRTIALLGFLLVACGGGGADSTSATADGGVSASEDGALPGAPARDCPRGKVQLVFSDGRPPREVCMTSSGIVRGPVDEAPNAANLAEVREGSLASHTAMINVQVDRATERQARLVILHLYPDAPASYFVRSCTNPPCAELQVGSSKCYEDGLGFAFKGLKLTSPEGVDVTLTGDLDAR